MDRFLRPFRATRETGKYPNVLIPLQQVARSQRYQPVSGADADADGDAAGEREGKTARDDEDDDADVNPLLEAEEDEVLVLKAEIEREIEEQGGDSAYAREFLSSVLCLLHETDCPREIEGHKSCDSGYRYGPLPMAALHLVRHGLAGRQVSHFLATAQPRCPSLTCPQPVDARPRSRPPAPDRRVRRKQQRRPLHHHGDLHRPLHRLDLLGRGIRHHRASPRLQHDSVSLWSVRFRCCIWAQLVRHRSFVLVHGPRRWR